MYAANKFKFIIAIIDFAHFSIVFEISPETKLQSYQYKKFILKPRISYIKNMS